MFENYRDPSAIPAFTRPNSIPRVTTVLRTPPDPSGNRFAIRRRGLARSLRAIMGARRDGHRRADGFGGRPGGGADRGHGHHRGGARSIHTRSRRCGFRAHAKRRDGRGARRRGEAEPDTGLSGCELALADGDLRPGRLHCDVDHLPEQVPVRGHAVRRPLGGGRARGQAIRDGHAVLGDSPAGGGGPGDHGRSRTGLLFLRRRRRRDQPRGSGGADGRRPSQTRKQGRRIAGDAGGIRRRNVPGRLRGAVEGDRLRAGRLRGRWQRLGSAQGSAGGRGRRFGGRGGRGVRPPAPEVAEPPGGRRPARFGRDDPLRRGRLRRHRDDPGQ